MANDIFFGYKENQAQAGYRSAILYKEHGQSKYQLLCPSETVPFPFGTKETFEFNLLNSPTNGQVEGKDTLEQKEVELLYTRNNAILFEKLKGKVLDFMSLTPQMIGYKYSGTIAFRPNDATSDIHRGTYTITPMSADPTPLLTARSDVLTPLYFADVIPDEISLANVGSGNVQIDVSVKNKPAGSNVKIKYTYTTVTSTNGVESEGDPVEVTATNDIITLPKTAGLYVIYAQAGTGTGESFTASSTHSKCFASVYVTE